MLSIRHMTLGSEDYYLDLAAEDYYLNGGEPLGVWLGEAAAELDLGQTVTREQLRKLMLGFSLDGQELVQNAGKLNRQSGWDLTFSAPKSVSVVWCLASSGLRQAIQECHQQAVAEAVRYLEQNAALTRRGHGGTELESAKLIVACFEHGTSREQDPQLHTHALFLNAALREDKTFGALRSKDFYDHKMTAGAVYRAALAYQLRNELGLDPKALHTWFELGGVPDTVTEEFSKRREQVKAEMDAMKAHGAKAAAKATIKTRSQKEHVAREDLLQTWRSVAEALGFSRDMADALSKERKPLSEAEQKEHAVGAVRQIIDEFAGERSYFAKRDLARGVAVRFQTGRVSPTAMQDAVEESLAGEDLVSLGRHNGHELFTTRDLLRLEEEILAMAERGWSKPLHLNTDDVHRGAVRDAAERAKLDGEQMAALKHLTLSRGSIKIVAGGAGTGKTRTLRAAKEVWKETGLRPIGVSLAAKAARGLQEASGMKGYTVAKLLSLLEDTPDKRMKHNLSLKGVKEGVSLDAVFTRNQRAVFNKPLLPKGGLRNRRGLKLTAKHVLVIDEAGMVGTRDMHRLLSHAERAGATVVLVGDHKQLPSIEAGAPFGTLLSRHRSAVLTKNWRQPIEWHAEATRQFANGDAQAALSLYTTKNRLSVHRSEQEAMEALIASWGNHRTDDLKESLILAGTRREATLLNMLAQAQRRENQELGRSGFIHEGTRYWRNDRVLFTKNSRKLGVDNGDAGTIVRIQHASNRRLRTVTVKLDRPKKGLGVTLPWQERVTFKVAEYDAFSLGYAATTHKAQGATIERTFVYAGDWMTDREMAYVQMSRHRDDCRIFGTVSTVGEDIAELAKLMKQSHTKQMAHEFKRAL